MLVVRIARNLNDTDGCRPWSLRSTSGQVIGWCRAAVVDCGKEWRSLGTYNKMVARGRRDVFACWEGSVSRLEGFVPSPRTDAAALLLELATVPTGVDCERAGGAGRVRFALFLDPVKRSFAPFESCVFTVDGKRLESAPRVRFLPDGSCYTN